MKSANIPDRPSLRCIVLLAMLAFACNVQAQSYPAVHAERPRIYVDEARFAWMRANQDIPGDFQTTYQAFAFRYENWWINDPELYLTGEDSTRWTWTWNSVYAKDEAVFTIFLFKLNQDDLALKRCRFLATKAIEALEAADYAAMAWFDKEDFLRLFSDVASLLIDWCHDDLPADMRDRLVRAHLAMTREFMTTYILSSAGNSYVSSHNAWNNVFVNQDLLTLFHAEALTPEQRDTLDQWYRIVYDKWIEGFLPVYAHYRDDDGGWNWGAAYAMWSLIDQFQFFDNMLIATGKDFYADLPWVRNSINQYWYFIRPDEWTIHHGDGITFLAGDRVIYRHAAIFQDPRSVWLADKYSTPAYYYSTPYVFQKLLFKDFTLPSVPHPQPPSNWWSDKVGLAVRRFNWDKDALMTTFFNAPSKRAAHEHRDNNSFTVFKNKPLMIDAGSYDTYAGSHYRNYYQRTIAHNSICVFDSTETYTAFGQPASNDGGQVESPALQNLADIFKPENQRGTWIKHVGRGNFQYNVADAQLSYSPDKLDFFRRRFLVLTHKIIILDHLHLNRTNEAQRDVTWLGHFMQRPSISGDLLQAPVPGHIERYDGPDFALRDGNASIAGRTLLPSGSTTTLVGGEGYEYWVDGVNYPPSSPPDTLHGTPGRWRIEVRPDTVTDTLVFLHMLVVGDSVNVALPAGTAYQNAYSVGAEFYDELYFFPADGDTGVTYHVFFNIPGDRIVSIFACDLAVGEYAVFVDDVPVTGPLTAHDGILYTYILLVPGEHKVEIKPFMTSTSGLATLRALQVYPNPADDELVVPIPAATSGTFTAELFNARGERVAHQTSRTTITLDTSGLPAGPYFLRLSDGQSFQTRTVTILH